MKKAPLIPLLIVPLLFACLPKKPEIPLTEAPAGPLMQELEQRHRSFSSLRALGTLKAIRKDRRRSFDSVGFLIEGEERFRIEAYGPLGQTLSTLLWDGKDLMLDYDGQRRVMPGKDPGLERVIGADVDPSDLCAALSGNVPGVGSGAPARLLCAPDGTCFLELRRGDATVRAHPNAGQGPGEPAVRSYEIYRDDSLVYRVRFENFAQVSGYVLPLRIIVDNPQKRMSLTVEYGEVEVNVPPDPGTFIIPD